MSAIRSLAALAALVGPLAGLAATSTNATVAPNVNVANTPNVNVVNTTLNPLPVQSLPNITPLPSPGQVQIDGVAFPGVSVEGPNLSAGPSVTVSLSALWNISGTSSLYAWAKNALITGTSDLRSISILYAGDGASGSRMNIFNCAPTTWGVLQGGSLLYEKLTLQCTAIEWKP